MRSTAGIPGARVSRQLYERLLALYPRAHREEYGPAMLQLFGDQCRDAWRDARGWGLAGLWLRVLPDLVKTSVLEHLATLNERKSMFERMAAMLRPRSAPSSVFVGVFVVVFLLVVTTSILVTFIMPESYASTARIKPGWSVNDRAGQAEFEAIESEAVLRKVIEDLDLNKAWGKKYAKGGRFKTSETIALLKARIDLRPVRGTSLIQIRVFSEDAPEAATLANAIAQTYSEDRTRSSPVEIVDKAVPGLRPVRPNKPLNIFLGVLGGMFLALAAGAVMAVIATLAGRKSRGKGLPSESGGPPPPNFPHSSVGTRARSVADKITGVLWMGLGALLSGVILILLCWAGLPGVFQSTSIREAGDYIFICVVGIFWGCSSLMASFLFRGKPSGRTYVGLLALLVVVFGLLTVWYPTEWLPGKPRGVLGGLVRLVGVTIFPFPYFPLPFRHLFYWVFIGFGAITVCALLWPRRRVIT